MLGAMALMAGCATGSSDVVCPPLVTYPKADQTQAASELRALPPGAVLHRFMDDYAAERAWVRAACH